MKVLVLGGDGYLGWPTSLYFSARNHDVMAVDNYFRRQTATKLDSEPLFPTPELPERCQHWHAVSGRQVRHEIGDITDYSFLGRVFREFVPDAVIHYAEQPSAPYSMISRETAEFTLKNNLVGTLNLAHAVREHNPQCHIIKLGTMGEYGTPDIEIEEGWIDIQHKGRKDRFLFPRQAGSLYHTTKIQDTDLLWFYVRTWKLRVTDLMQGPVYGLFTEETEQHAQLAPHFCYDEVFGTVLNRFVTQAIVGYPLTVYGTGGQKRGYLNLLDTMACVYLSALNPPQPGELRVFNQITEVFSVNELANRVAQVGSRLGLRVNIDHIRNPRVEKEDHFYRPAHTGLNELGLKPHLLTEETLERIMRRVAEYKARIRAEQFFRGISWK